MNEIAPVILYEQEIILLFVGGTIGVFIGLALGVLLTASAMGGK